MTQDKQSRYAERRLVIQCAACKLVLSDGAWVTMPTEGQRVSHGLCPVCEAKANAELT